MIRRAAAIVLWESSVLLVRRRRSGTEYFTLPGGGVEPGETPVQACVRELKEETSLAVEIRAEVCVLENRDREEHYFLVTEFVGVPELGDPERGRCGADNSYELVWVELDEIRRVNLKPRRLKKMILSLDETSPQGQSSRRAGDVDA